MRSFLAGLGTGFAVGVLVAPVSGSEARRDLRAKLSEFEGLAGEQVDKLKRRAGSPQQVLQRRKRRATPYLDQAEEAAKTAKGKIKETADALSSATAAGPLNMLNTASREDLLAVYGIGPVLADKIIKSRPYRSEREVLDRGIVPENTFKQLARSLKSS